MVECQAHLRGPDPGIEKVPSSRPRSTKPPILASGSGIRWVLLAFLAFSLGGCATDPYKRADTAAYGIWSGPLPCADCAGIDARLVLWRDPGFFRFTETYADTGNGPKTLTSYGQWSLEKVGKTPQLGRLKLDIADAERSLYLERLPDGSLRLLGEDGQAGDREEEFILKRTRALAE